MTQELKKELDLIYENHIKELNILLIEHRINQSEKSYKREFERFSKELIIKHIELNESKNSETDKYIILLQEKSKSILNNFLT